MASVALGSSGALHPSKPAVPVESTLADTSTGVSCIAVM
jgi:hypothetical protein